LKHDRFDPAIYQQIKEYKENIKKTNESKKLLTKSEIKEYADKYKKDYADERSGLMTAVDVAKLTGIGPTLVRYYQERLKIKFSEKYGKYLWTFEDVIRLLREKRTAQSRETKKRLQARKNRLKEQGYMPPSEISRILKIEPIDVVHYYANILYKSKKREIYKWGTWRRDDVEGLLNYYNIPIPHELLDNYFQPGGTEKGENQDTGVAWRERKPLCKKNTSGYTGVSFSKASKKWRAAIKFEGKLYVLGYFEKKAAAVNARKKAEIEFDELQSKKIIGKKFGRLTVLEKTGIRRPSGAYLYRCKCDCGSEVLVGLSNLKCGGTKSCGCLFREQSEIVNKRPVYFDGTSISRIKSPKRAKNNTSGHTGVSFIKRRKKWEAAIYLRGKTIHLGIFDRIEDAIQARKKAEKEYFDPLIKKFEEREV
jgi:DNA-binding transcriptional MerR regulator